MRRLVVLDWKKFCRNLREQLSCGTSRRRRGTSRDDMNGRTVVVNGVVFAG